MKITNIQQYKNIRKVQRILDDLKKVEDLLTDSIKNIAIYKRYTPAKSVLSNLMENKALVMVYLKRCKTILDKYNAAKLEKTSEEYSD